MKYNETNMSDEEFLEILENMTPEKLEILMHISDRGKTTESEEIRHIRDDNWDKGKHRLMLQKVRKHLKGE